MNSITITGRLVENAKKVLIKTNFGERGMAIFVLRSDGMPYQRKGNMEIEVDFFEEAAMSLLPYLVKNKEVVVFGHLESKNYLDAGGKEVERFYVSAKQIELVGGVPYENDNPAKNQRPRN